MPKYNGVIEVGTQESECIKKIELLMNNFAFPGADFSFNDKGLYDPSRRDLYIKFDGDSPHLRACLEFMLDYWQDEITFININEVDGNVTTSYHSPEGDSLKVEGYINL